jgi:hypothetical protein
VGGHSRNIGKTSVAAGLIRELRERRWTAVKITQYRHGERSHAGDACGCEAAPGHPFALSEEHEPGGTDTGRFLAAGAALALWLRTRTGGIAGAAGALDRILARGGDVIVESNSILELLRPDLFLMVVDLSCDDWKPSSLRYLDRADALVVIERQDTAPPRERALWGLSGEKPRFPVRPPVYVTTALTEFVRDKLRAAR